MSAPGMLNGVGTDRELVNLSKEKSILDLRRLRTSRARSRHDGRQRTRQGAGGSVELVFKGDARRSHQTGPGELC